MIKILQILGLPENHSLEGIAIDNTIAWTHLLMAILFLFWAPFFIYVLLRFRKSKNPIANYPGMKSHFSSYFEGGVAVFEAVLLFGFAFPVWEVRVNKVPDESTAEVVRVVAQQFKWNIHYPGHDGKFGTTAPELIDDQALNFMGLDKSSETGKDDIVPPQGHLHLPVNKPALIYLSTRDVMHSFFIPVMRVKQDVIPGLRIPVWFTPTQTGSWEIACAQLCGNSHYQMKGFVHVHTPKGYQAYMETLGIVQEVDDYQLTFEAEKTLGEAIEALKEGDAPKAEQLSIKAQSQAKAALEEKEEVGEEDEWWEEW